MARVQFNTIASEDTKSVWGYQIEKTADGIFGEVPDDLIELELAAGRVKLVGATPKKVEVAEVAEVAQTAQDVIENGSGKRGPGRPPKAE